MAISIDRERTALLVMDLQKHMVDEESSAAQKAGFAEMVKKTGLIQRVRRVMDAARQANMLVVTVRVDFTAGLFPRYPTRGAFCRIIAAESIDGETLRPGAWDFEIVEEVAPLSGEPIVSKRHMSAFAGSNLDEVLRSRGITDIAMTGVATSYVITATNWSALNYGYSCIVIEDCCTTHDDETQKAAINTLRAIADICTAEEFVRAIQ